MASVATVVVMNGLRLEVRAEVTGDSNVTLTVSRTYTIPAFTDLRAESDTVIGFDNLSLLEQAYQLVLMTIQARTRIASELRGLAGDADSHEDSVYTAGASANDENYFTPTVAGLPNPLDGSLESTGGGNRKYVIKISSPATTFKIDYLVTGGTFVSGPVSVPGE